MSATNCEVSSSDGIRLHITFYDKKERNKFNANLKKLLTKSNVNYTKLEYNEYTLPILDDTDKSQQCYSIEYSFVTEKERNKFNKFIRENMKGYYG